MKKKELIFIAAVLVAAGGLWGGLQLTKPDSYKSITITVRGKEYGTYSLEKDQTIKINDTNTAEIKDGQIAMIDASCPDHLCMYQSPVNQYGGLIVCLPNEVIIEGERIASSEDAVDVIAQ